jgi:NADP-dependent 3-hydroxy acid dehydrogenase YdfG
MPEPLAMTVAITGASAGVGRATAVRLASAGARVALIARSADALDEVKREIESNGGEALSFALDVSDAEALAAAATAVVERWGAIDVWINNAMVTMFSPISEMSSAEFRRITEVTYLGCVYGTMAALIHMRPRKRGTIIQVGSALSYRAIPLQSAYCGAKFAIRAFTDSLRSELKHEGSPVRLTMIQLPAVNTPQFDWARNRLPRRPRPLAPIFQPEAIAEVIQRAIRTTPRELWVGLPALKTILGALLVPGMLDTYLARKGYDGQLSEEPPSADGDGNLFAAASTGHAIHGRFAAESKSNVVVINPAVLRAALAAAMCAAAILLVCCAV